MSEQQPYLFLDRDGTLIDEPDDFQVDHVDKLKFLEGVFDSLSAFKAAGYQFVIVTNQNGIGTETFSQAEFDVPNEKMMAEFSKKGIDFESVLVCPHFAEVGCECRKPKTGLVDSYIKEAKYDKARSYFIGDRLTDVELADKMGIKGIQISSAEYPDWQAIEKALLTETV